MMLVILLALACLLMSGAVWCAVAIGASGTPIDGFDDGIDNLGRIICWLILSLLMVLQSIVWMMIGSGYGGAW